MGARKDLSVSFSRLSQKEVEEFCMSGVLARVLHFEVLCRASGYDPTLLSFRRFFCLVKNGEWFTYETSKVDNCFV
ncbi:hypothetical protein Hanom_Chr04g00339761 [Helianthus anomalus]